MIFPTGYFPSFYYLQKLCEHPKVIIESHEHWIKQSIRNRCMILTAEGVQRLTLPIVHSENKQAIHQIEIDDSKNWRIKHWRAIQTAYGNAPYFEYYDEEIKSLLLNNCSHLWELNKQILLFFIQQWELPIELKASETFVPYQVNDSRHLDWLNPNIEHKPYQQVIGFSKEFIPNLSVLDLLMCEGPMGRKLLIC